MTISLSIKIDVPVYEGPSIRNRRIVALLAASAAKNAASHAGLACAVSNSSFSWFTIERAAGPAAVFLQRLEVIGEVSPRVRGFEHMAQDLGFEIDRPRTDLFRPCELVGADRAIIDFTNPLAGERGEQPAGPLTLNANGVSAR